MKRLLLFFNDRSEYQQAKSFFEAESEFTASKHNDEFKCITFEEVGNIDALEMALTGELTENGFQDFYFDAE